jgi:predicted phosphodiesterase
MESPKLFDCSKRIGLIADSHGNLNSIEQGIVTLREFRFHALVHLGDIFDSLENDDLFEIFQTVKHNNFLTVKGNNDFQVENLLSNGHSFDVSLIQKKKNNIILKTDAHAAGG